MKATIAGLSAERYPPEKSKFKAPILLVHGPWAGSWSWESWATHFCNLGWDCWAVNLPGRSLLEAERLKNLTVIGAAAELARAALAASSPPVLLAHGAGALVALAAAQGISFAALVLAAPAPPRSANVPVARALRLLRLKYLPLLFLRRPFRIQEKDLRQLFLASLPESLQAKISRRTVPESHHLAGEFFKPRLDVEPARIRCPRLVVFGGQDPLMPPASSRAVAHWLKADCNEYPNQGHWIIEADGELIVRDIHRWLVQKLGDQVLIAELS